MCKVCEEHDKQLFLTASQNTGGLGREQFFADVELVVNARCETLDADSAFGFGLYDKDGEPVLSVLIAPGGIDVIGEKEASFALPEGWDLADYHAYRVMTRNGTAKVWAENYFVGEVEIARGPYCPAVLAQKTTIALDMVRVTGI